jgi:ATP-dependent protease ClpP protease subunit
MNSNKVIIKGQIGTSYNEDGSVLVAGVELEDVVSQLEPLLNMPEVFVEITSEGGFVSTGKAIANYISKFANVKTLAKDYCCSIATEIHLAVPLMNRFIEAGTEYMIHNPLLQNVSGNASELIEWANAIKPMQDEMAKMYAKATGLSKEAVQGLMNQETSLTDVQCVTLGFASKVLPKIGLKAVALIEMNINKNKIAMSKFTEDVKKVLVSLGIVSEPNGRQAMAMSLPSDKGVLETPYADLMVGDPVMIDGVPANDDTYVLEDGTQIIVIGGMVSEIIPATGEPVDSEEVTALKNQIAELTAQLETSNIELTSVKEEQVAVMEVLAKAKLVKSTHTPKAVAYVPVKKDLTKGSILAQARAEREAYKNKK